MSDTSVYLGQTNLGKIRFNSKLVEAALFVETQMAKRGMVATRDMIEGYYSNVDKAWLFRYIPYSDY